MNFSVIIHFYINLFIKFVFLKHIGASWTAELELASLNSSRAIMFTFRQIPPYPPSYGLNSTTPISFDEI